MLYLAQGTLSIDSNSPQKILYVPYGTTHNSSNPTEVTSVSKIVEGNLIVRGSDDYPIHINGKVFVRGDLVIGGKITGIGSIYSGRNIYVIDNLDYKNPPPGLDGSKPSNEKLTLVSYCRDKNSGTACDCEQPVNCTPVSNALDLKNQWEAAGAAAGKAYDQVMLFATNNIVVGDPYPENVEFAPGKRIQPWNFLYAVKAILEPNFGEFAMDRVQGYLLDTENLSLKRYLYPWAKKDSYFQNPDVTVKPNPPIYAYAYSDGYTNSKHPSLASGVEGDRDYLFDRRQFGQSPAYQTLFLPKNTARNTSGTWDLKDWISESDFRSRISGTESQTKALTKDSFGRHGRIKTIPITSAAKYPSTPARWQTGMENATSSLTEGMVKSLDDLTGILAEAKEGSGSSQRVYVNSSGTNAVSLSVALQEFFSNAKQGLLNGGVSSDSINRNTPEIDKDLSGMKAWRFSAKFHFDSQYCWTTANADHRCDCKASGMRCGRAFTEVLWFGPDYNGERVYCDDRKGTGDQDYRGTSFTIPRCQSRLTNANTLDDSREKSQATDLIVLLVYHYDEVADFRATVHTRYWDSARLPARSRVQRIDSFLFANHYLFSASETYYGNDLRIRGGVVAKDFAGYFGNMLDPTTENTTPPTAFYANTALYNVAPLPGAADPGLAMGLQIWLDPRAQFYTDFLYSDFGSRQASP